MFAHNTLWSGGQSSPWATHQYQRSEVALKLKPLLAKKAKEKQSQGGVVGQFGAGRAGKVWTEEARTALTQPL